MAEEDLKYGCINPIGKAVTIVPMAATQALSNNSGKFVYMDDGAATLSADGIGTIFGFLQAHAHTPSTGDYLPCIIDTNAIFKIPVNTGTYVVGMIGESCDISISSGVQGAQLDASAEDTLIIVGGDLDNNDFVYVRLNPAKIISAGVA